MPNIEKPNQQFEKRNQTYKIIDAILQQPELKEAMEKGNFIWQNKFHEFDVYDHSADYLKHILDLTTDPDIIAAAYLHDIGKPMVAKPKKDKKTGKAIYKDANNKTPYHDFTDHEKIGAQYVRDLDPKIFNNINKLLSNSNIRLDKEKIAQLINCHYLPMKGIKSLREIIKNNGKFEEWQKRFQELTESLDKPEEAPDISKEEILTMFLADKLAQGPNLPDKNELLAIREIMANENFSIEDLKMIYQIQQENFKNKVYDY